VQVTAWNNGGVGYGLEIRASDRDRYFDRDWQNVVLELAGQGNTVVRVSDSFWRDCCELRSAEIGRWLKRNGLAPWPKGQRPKVVMQHLTGNRFAVRLPSLS
jgi:hypothetical protein